MRQSLSTLIRTLFLPSLFSRFGSASLIALWFVLLLSGEAAADDIADEAEVQFNLGAESYQAGDFMKALSHFLASNRLANNRRVLFNVARAYEQLRQYPEAHRYYTRSLEGETNPATVALCQEALARIGARVAMLDIQTDPPGAHLFLDRKDLGERGVGPLRVALTGGRYRVIAALEGYEDASSEAVVVEVGGQVTVRLQLRRIVGTLRVEQPLGAAVRLDAQNVSPSCTAPCSVEVSPGSHTVVLSLEGHRTQQVPISVERNKVTTIRTTLAPETGTLVVNSDERGAEVQIDGTVMGFTPVLISLPVGSHAVRVGSPGFRSVFRQVNIRASQQTTTEVELVASDTVEAASRLVEPMADAPASVSLVGSRELRTMRYPTITEALRGVRGLYVTDDRGYPSLGIRGSGLPGVYGNRVLVTLDGMPLNDDWVWSSYASFDSRTDLDDIDHIEVVRGPGSVLYGTSAFAGVIDLVTRGREVPTSREIGISAAGDGVMRARARVTHHFTKDLGVWASIAGGRSSGRDFYFPEYVEDGPAEVAGWARGLDSAKFATLNGRAWLGALSLGFYLNHHDKGFPTGEYETLFGDSRNRQVDTRGFVELRFEPKLSSQLTSLTRAHVNLYAYRGFFAYPPDWGGLERDKYDSTWVGAEQRFLWSPGRAFTASIGVEGQAHPNAHQQVTMELDGPLLNNRKSFVLGAAYANLDLRPVEALKISAGGRFDYYSTFGGSFNPRVGFVLKPYEGGNFKLILGKAFKAPSILELYYESVDQISSPNLQPENVYSAELEISQRLSPTVTATVAGFANYVTDLIALESRPDETGAEILRYVNSTGPVGTMGVEVEVAREWREGWMVAASYSFQRSVLLASRTIDSFVNLRRSPNAGEIPNAPTHLAAVRLGVPILSRALIMMNRVTLDGGRYTQDRAEANPRQIHTDPAVLYDLVFTGVESRFGIDYSLGIYNAFDSKASVPVSDEFRQRTLQISGRSLLASISVTF
jgi:outer membrane receptor protein involved in Fe transport